MAFTSSSLEALICRVVEHVVSLLSSAALWVVFKLQTAIRECSQKADPHVQLCVLSIATRLDLHEQREQAISTSSCMQLNMNGLTNFTKMALSTVATLSRSRLQTAPRDVSETVTSLLWKPADAFEKGDTLASFSANLKWPLPTKSR